MMDGDTALRQAHYTAETYMVEAVREIDKLFGEGYAKKNPSLVGVFMQVAAADFHTAEMGGNIEGSQIAETLETIGLAFANLAKSFDRAIDLLENRLPTAGGGDIDG